MANKLRIDNLSAPLNGATAARVNIDSRSGNLTIDPLPSAVTAGEAVLATGTLEYFEKQGPPTRIMNANNGQVTFTLRGEKDTGRPWFRFPWDACNGATEWQVHLNPNVQSDITVRTGGGNVKIDLAGMAVSCLSADTGGGNMDVLLPDKAANLSVTARTGGGNVTVKMGQGTTGANTITVGSGAGAVSVRVPAGLSARIHATSGLGKVIVDPQFSQIDRSTYQSPDYDTAANKVEITAKSGAGVVVITTETNV